MDILLMLVSIFIALIAQLIISATYSKYKKISGKNGLTGFEAARIILDKNGLNNVYIVEVRGNLTDHYDPKQKTVRLSTEIYNGTSISSLAVAAHECGHAIQDKDNYNFLRIRSTFVPIVNISSKLSYFAILFGFIFGVMDLIYVGIAALLIILLFELITLPVEYNASSRAKKCLIDENIIDNKELSGAKSVLNAAALTYVASVLTTMLQVFRLILISRDRD